MKQTASSSIVEAVKKHMLSQMTRCVDTEGHLRWRTTNSDGKVLRCAVGCLIPDHLYTPALETVGTVEALFAYFPPGQGLAEHLGVTPQNRDMIIDALVQLQAVHDRLGPSRWESALMEIS